MDIASTLGAANSSLADARRVRAEWLTRVHFGHTDVPALIRQACEPGYEPLLRIPLVRLLAEQDGWNGRKAIRVVARTHRLLEIDVPERRAMAHITVHWLVDGRSGGRRIMAFCDAARPRSATRPWDGFPYFSPSIETGI